jgi:hypothetical protein
LDMHFIKICWFEISKLRQIIYPICTQWVYLGEKYTHATFSPPGSILMVNYLLFSCSLEGQYMSWVHLQAPIEFTLIELIVFIQNILCRPFYRYGWRRFQYKPKLNVARGGYYNSCTVLGTISTIHPWEHEMAWRYKQQLLKHLWVSIRARVAVLSGKEMSKGKIVTWLPWQLGIK